MKRVLAVTFFSFVACLMAFAQESPLIDGELKITITHASSFPIEASVWLQGMAFVGSNRDEWKTYSDVYTSNDTTKSIVGGSQIFATPDSWYIQHVEDGGPSSSDPWIAYGLYKITVGTSYFYLDYLDSDYPFGETADISVDYDVNRSGSHLLVQAIATKYPNNGEVLQIRELYDRTEAPGTDFQLPATVPVSSKSCDTLFTMAYVNTYVTLPASKTLKIYRTGYPDESTMGAVGLKYSGSSTRLLVYGNLDITGASGSHVTVDGESYSRSGLLYAPIVIGSGGTATIQYADFCNSPYGVTLYTSAGNTAIEHCTFSNFVSDANAKAVTVSGATGTIAISSNTLSGPGEGTGIYLNSTGTNVTVSGNTVSDFGTGIRPYSSDANLTGNTLRPPGSP